MKKIILISALVMCSLTGFSKIWTIINVSFTFSPATLTITEGDSVDFSIASIHEVVEVSQATWNIDGTTPLPGGFSTPFGGGIIPAAQLTVGTHWYVCAIHASMGMKGTITVNSITGARDIQSHPDISLFPNPAKDLITVNMNRSFTDLHYSLINLEGKQVLEGQINSEIFSLDISRLDKGIYLFQVLGPLKKTIKIVKY